MKRNYCIYKHTCPNEKVYIGITGVNPLDRWRNGKGYSTNKHFNRAIEKYGWKNIEHEILVDNLTKEEAQHYECVIIEAYRSNEPEYGYNISDGGELGNLGVVHSKESYQRAWETRRKNKRDVPWNKGVRMAGKPVVQRNKNGEIIGKYKSAREAFFETGVNSAHISSCCNGERKSAGGYIWARE